MVQEVYVLQCFSCSTFQTHIVKKTNKWECKICGSKQSIKKVFGRGSGKDCRLHTQKLNALKGEKETIKNEWNSEEETEETSPETLQCNKYSLDYKINQVIPKASKWNIYVDEKKTNDVEKYSPVLERNKPNSVGRMKSKDADSKKKRKFNLLETDFSGLQSDLIGVEQINDSIASEPPNFSFLKLDNNAKKVKCGKRYNNTVTDYHSKSVIPTLEICEESENKSLHNKLKVKKQGLDYTQPKVNNKWLKYLDETSAEEQNYCSPTSAENLPCISFTDKSGDVPENILNCGNSTYNFSNFQNKVSYNDGKRKSSYSEYCYSKSKNQENADNIIEEADEMVCLNELVKECGNTVGKNQHSFQLLPPRPVFEQNCDLNDSDFQLDF